MKAIGKVLFLAVLALVFISSYVIADDSQMGRCESMCKHDKMHSKMDVDEIFYKKAHCVLANADELGLSDEQAAKVKELKHSTKKSVIKNDAEIELLGLDIKEALGKDEVDINAVNGLIDKKYAVKAAKAKELIGACTDLKKVLTKDQQKKLKEMWSSCMKGEGKCGMMGEKKERAMCKMESRKE